jgi:hypothetical protein
MIVGYVGRVAVDAAASVALLDGRAGFIGP